MNILNYMCDCCFNNRALKCVLRLSISLTLGLFFVFSAFAQDTYEADVTKLDAKAGRSKDLYVEPEFNFATHRVYTVDFSVVDRDGEPVSGAMLLVSSIPIEVKDIDDLRLKEKSLMSILRTDQYGRAYQLIEASLRHTHLLVELNRQSENSKVIFDANNQGYLSYHFMLN